MPDWCDWECGPLRNGRRMSTISQCRLAIDGIWE